MSTNGIKLLLEGWIFGNADVLSDLKNDESKDLDEHSAETEWMENSCWESQNSICLVVEPIEEEIKTYYMRVTPTKLIWNIRENFNKQTFTFNCN